VINRLNTVPRYLLTILIPAFLLVGCHSVTTMQLCDRSDISPDQLTTLEVPWCISLRTLDGSPAPSTMANELRLILAPGPHTLEARYVVLYPTRGNDSEKIASDYIRLTYNAAAGKTYTLCSKDPKSLEETRRYAANVSLWIVEKSDGAGKGESSKFHSSMPTVSTNSNTGAKTTSSVTGNQDVQTRLQEIWDKASAQDRKEFRDKINQQNP